MAAGSWLWWGQGWCWSGLVALEVMADLADLFVVAPVLAEVSLDPVVETRFSEA